MEKKSTPNSSVQAPFQDRVNIHLFFSGAHRRKLLDDVKKAIADGAAVITLTGEEGVGKTMICKMVEKETEPEHLCVYLPNTLESFDDVVRVLALKVGTPNGENPVSTKILVDEIADELRESGRHLVVIFDQSERMYLATIERIRKMLDRVNIDQVVLQIVFSGRRSLLENLKQLAICDFKNVEEKHFFLNALGLSETYAYLNHCAQLRSSVRGKNVFTPEAAKKIFSMAQGNLRMTNMLAAKSLEAADSETSFMVLLENVHDENISQPAKESKRRHWRFNLPTIWWTSGGGLILLLLLFFIFSGGEEDSLVAPADSPNRAEIVLAQKDVKNTKQSVEALQPAEKDVTISSNKGKPQPKAVNKAEAKKQQTQVQQPPKESIAPQGKEEKEVALKNKSDSNKAKAVAKEGKQAVDQSELVAQAEGLQQKSSRPHEDVARKKQITDKKPSPTETAVKQEKNKAGESSHVQVSPLSVQERQKDSAEEQGGKQVSAAPKKETEVEPATAPSVPTAAEGDIVEEASEDGSEIEPVVFVGMKKRLPPPEINENLAKEIVQIAPAKVKIAIQADSSQPGKSNGQDDSSVDSLFAERVAAGEKWLVGEHKGSHTVQLMALKAAQAEENLKNRLREEQYRQIADKLYIVKDNDSTVFVYYGIYPDMESARKARNTLPIFLRKHDPYAVSVNDAIEKAGAGQQ